MKRLLRSLCVLSAALLFACDPGSEPQDAAPTLDARLDPDASGDDVGELADAAVPPSDAAVPEVRCAAGVGPYLVVTEDDLTRTGSSVIARLPVQVTGAVSGLEILGIEERIDGAAVRTWDIADVRAPAGFDGALTPESGTPNPTAMFLAVTDADAAELSQCALAPWDRADGSLTVRVRTNETGEVTLTCAIGIDFSGRGPEAVDLSCARGVPGWLGPRPNLSDVTTPGVFRLMDSEVHALNGGSAPVDGFLATSATLRTTYGLFPGEMGCADPTEWTTTGGIHQLWRGASSSETWSGPLAPATEERASWLWQEPAAFPPGFCFPGGAGPPDECLRPAISLTLSGTSSAGGWTWESDLFDCLAF